MARLKMNEQRFWANVNKRDAAECWPWVGGRISGGYGSVNFDGHRAALALSGALLPPGSVVRHLCDNPPCCNPAHLAVGTQSDNIRDMYAKGRANVPSGLLHHLGGKTHCAAGHAFDDANTIHRKAPMGGPGRACRECGRIRAREYQRRKASARKG